MYPVCCVYRCICMLDMGTHAMLYLGTYVCCIEVHLSYVRTYAIAYVHVHLYAI